MPRPKELDEGPPMTPRAEDDCEVERASENGVEGAEGGVTGSGGA